ncbi:hypothetical protein FRC0087_01813 [Corynebacterium diphtheriae]|nr:hypothetical protein FRC0087_01813 [Corynebacterium diphtheriae]
MAGKSAILSVRIIADAAKAKAGFDEASDAVGKFEKKTGQKLANVQKHVDKVAGFATVAAGAWIGLAKQSLDSASDMQQSTGAVEAVFKDQAEAVKKLAESAATSVGLSASQYQNMAAVMGSQLRNLGIEQGEVIGTTDKLITLGADLASMFGGTTADAVEALSSLLRGERDPIERYAVSINQAAIDAELAAQGLDGLEGSARKQAETQAVLKLLFDQTADATGNFARETDTASGSAQIAAAKWNDTKAVLGEQFLPIATAAADTMADLSDIVKQHPDLFKNAGIAIGIFTGVTLALGAALKAAAWWSAALNATMLLNPFGIVVGAIAAVTAAVVILYKKWDKFREYVDLSVFAVKNFGDVVPFLIGKAIDWVKGLFDSWDGVRKIAGIAAQALVGAVTGFTSPITAAIGLVRNLIEWIDRIDFPEPPAWVRKVAGALYGSATPALVAVPPSSGLLTASRSVPRLAGYYRGAPRLRSDSRPAPTIINVTVSDSVVGDERLLADVVTRAIDNTDAFRGKGPVVSL